MHIRSSVIAVAMLLSQVPALPAFATEDAAPYEQDFVLTAYYSPLPDQCCYVKGSYEADVILNGNGTHGADGTPVYPGMVAAPPSYAFGTRIDLPGLGVFTVHDRGGAIQEWSDAHRIDVWMGSGEEGLARALAFGVRSIRGTVYPLASDKPAESFDVAAIPAPDTKLQPYVTAGTQISELHPVNGQRGYSVRLLQQNLADLGYFDHEVTGLYGQVTADSVATFNKDMGIDNEPSLSVSQKTGAYLQAALAVKNAPSPVVFVGKESAPSDVKAAQRTLRYLGYYRGRTDGQYSSILFNAILSYQRNQQLVGNATAPGAGRIGPVTKSKLDHEMLRRRVARTAAQILAMEEVAQTLEKNGELLTSTMSAGSNGKNVRMLQEFLASAGYFPKASINGNFGAQTADAVAKYQVAHELLKSTKEKGAGTVGPVTLHTIRTDQTKRAMNVVRAEGWQAL